MRVYLRVMLPAVVVFAMLTMMGAGGTRPAVPAGRSGASRGGAELYEQIAKQYLAADWDTLAADLAKTREITTMTKEQQADVAYIRTALAECRPAWWAQVKLGRAVAIRPVVWQRTLQATFEPGGGAGHTYRINRQSQQASLTVQWQAAGMDSKEKTGPAFTRGDQTCEEIWSFLERVSITVAANGDRLGNLSDDEQMTFDRFMQFRGNVTALYYGTPRARQLAVFHAMNAVAITNTMEPQRPTGAMLLAEFVSQRGRYPSLTIPKAAATENVELELANELSEQFTKIQEKWTLAEDRTVREVVKAFATANGIETLKTGRMNLPNKLSVSVNEQADLALAAARNKWLKEELAKARSAAK